MTIFRFYDSWGVECTGPKNSEDYGLVVGAYEDIPHMSNGLNFGCGGPIGEYIGFWGTKKEKYTRTLVQGSYSFCISFCTIDLLGSYVHQASFSAECCLSFGRRQAMARGMRLTLEILHALGLGSRV